MDLYLVRHGETDWNRVRRLQGRADIPLNDSGRRQAAATAQRLRGCSLGGVVSSPLLRASQTGEILSATLGLAAPKTDSRLVERSYGAKEGLTPGEVASRFPEGAVVPGVEPMVSVRDRALAALDAAVLAASVSVSALVVTTHGAVIRSLVTHLAPGVADTLDTPIRNGSIHQFTWDPGSDTRSLACFDLAAVDPLAVP